jgi:MFS family permease
MPPMLVTPAPRRLISRRCRRSAPRFVIAGLGATGCAVALVIIFADATTPTRLFPLAFLYGGAIFSLYPLSVSHAADHPPSDGNMLQPTQGLLLANGAGMAIGPLVAGGFFHLPVAVLGSISVLALLRIVRRAPAATDSRKPFIHLPETTPAGLSMDPRAIPSQPELDSKATSGASATQSV